MFLWDIMWQTLIDGQRGATKSIIKREAGRNRERTVKQAQKAQYVLV